MSSKSLTVANNSSKSPGARGVNGKASEAYVSAIRFRAILNRISFFGFVVLPTVLAVLFFGVMASPRYVSEVRFIVRGVSAPRIGGIDMLFRTFGMAKTVDDAYVIQKYLISRDVIDGLSTKGINLKEYFTASEADFLSKYPRFWQKNTKESLYEYFLDRIKIEEDSVKGILTLRVTTFRPDDSRKLAEALLQLAEEMVNRMNERAQRDTMSSSLSEVRTAEDNVIKTQGDMAAFRNREITIDPSKSSLSVLETIGSLSTDLAYASTTLRQMKSSTPNSPGIQALTAKIAALDDRIKTERAKIAGGDGALSAKIGQYEQLALRRELADKGLAAALTALDSARQESRRQHIYIEEVVRPNLSDESTEPERLRGVLTVLVLGFALFSITWILSVGAGEHAQ